MFPSTFVLNITWSCHFILYMVRRFTQMERQMTQMETQMDRNGNTNGNNWKLKGVNEDFI